MRIIQNHEKLVKRKFPKSRIVSDFEGNVFVELPSDDIDIDVDNELNGIIPAQDYFMPMTNSIELAWKYALMCLRIEQNFNRTHPERIIDEDFDARLERIQERNNKKDK